MPTGLKKMFLDSNEELIIEGSATAKSTINNNLNQNISYNINPVTFGYGIFDGCRSLTEFSTYYKGYVSDDNRCYISNSSIMFFAGGNISSYTIPDNIIEINKTAFKGCISLENITLRNSVKIIGESAFENCQKLVSINNWDNVESISKNAFFGCYELGKISFPSKLKTIGNYAFVYCKKMYTNTNIPSTVTSIGSFAFSDCYAFKYVDETTGEQQPLDLKNITCINQQAFYNCTALSKVNLNDIIGYISHGAFENCSSLESVSISPSSSLYSINNNAFKGCTSLTQLYLPGNCLEYIGNSAFENCHKFIGNNNDCLEIPPTVTSIGSSCFKNTSIEVLYISSSCLLSSISDYAFDGCVKLNRFISKSLRLKSIGSYAFGGCRQLCNNDSDARTLYLPNSITYIGDYAFADCTNVASVMLPTNLVSLGHCSLATGWSMGKIIIPASLGVPPQFTLNTYVSDMSYPFGPLTNTLPKIVFSNVLLHSLYKKNTFWKLYQSKMVVSIKKERT